MRQLSKRSIDVNALSAILEILFDTKLDEISQLREIKDIMTNWAIHTKEWANQ